MTIGYDWEEKVVIAIDGFNIYPSKEFVELLLKELTNVKLPTRTACVELEDVIRLISYRLKNWEEKYNKDKEA